MRTIVLIPEIVYRKIRDTSSILHRNNNAVGRRDVRTEDGRGALTSQMFGIDDSRPIHRPRERLVLLPEKRPC